MSTRHPHVEAAIERLDALAQEMHDGETSLIDAANQLDRIIDNLKAE